MEENNKLFVFEKKEVILIFVFIILIAIISFTLGVRTGKELSLKHDNYTNEDINNINLKSVDEEYVEQVVKKDNDFENSMENSAEGEAKSLDAKAMEQRLKEEMEKLASESDHVPMEGDKPETESNAPSKMEEQSPQANNSESSDNNFTGKYTIQLFSHQNESAAQEFADVFRLKGYDVIINEVVIPGKGKWYRVSIGVFDNMNDAKDYLTKEKSLFQNQKYLIQQI